MPAARAESSVSCNSPFPPCSRSATRRPTLARSVRDVPKTRPVASPRASNASPRVSSVSMDPDNTPRRSIVPRSVSLGFTRRLVESPACNHGRKPPSESTVATNCSESVRPAAVPHAAARVHQRGALDGQRVNADLSGIEDRVCLRECPPPSRPVYKLSAWAHASTADPRRSSRHLPTTDRLDCGKRESPKSDCRFAPRTRNFSTPRTLVPARLRAH